MATQIAGAAGEALTPDGGAAQPVRQGRLAEVVVTELHGKYFEMARGSNSKIGRVFQATMPAGVAIVTGASGASGFSRIRPAPWPR